jgi:glycerate kinase
MQILKFEEQLKEADWVITGEGQIDSQSIYGKVVKRVVEKANRHTIPVIGICGNLKATPQEIRALGLKAAFSVCRGPGTLEDAIAETRENLCRMGMMLGGILL